MPTLILWGENDQAFPAPNQDRLRRALPGARFREYARVGHNPHWEIPQEVAAEITGFLASATRSNVADGPPAIRP
jgi:pimeloyl-ACP methyl ester carboxylesterase